jgi:hypothetical protein
MFCGLSYLQNMGEQWNDILEQNMRHSDYNFPTASPYLNKKHKQYIHFDYLMHNLITKSNLII